jgi:hypothetical protein
MKRCEAGWSGVTALALFLLAGGLAPCILFAASNTAVEIVDPCLGTRWQLRFDAAHPERPGRLVLVEPPPDRKTVSKDQAARPAPSMAIRAGDRVTVDQQTATVHAQLQAVAIESAAPGQLLKVRLGAGSNTSLSGYGPVIAVVALASGHARWLATERNSQ